MGLLQAFAGNNKKKEPNVIQNQTDPNRQQALAQMYANLFKKN
ncbi:MAG: hypothetical protein UU06_C0012G0004 [Parcubacteria group bacterium GW2011_GWB1_40_5]|nr:MAG: hypothetical protein UU06_C0012G0004 [Parcubacteria group bacterium GW2011_GWB1_40_5]